MNNFGRMTSFIHQQCYNHALHLAVLDVIYKKNDNNMEDDKEDEEDDADESLECYFGSGSNELSFADENYEQPTPLIRNILNRVRKIVRLFTNRQL